MREFTRLIFSSTTQLSNNGILIGIVSVPPNPQSTRGLRSHHHHFPLAICMEKAATVSFPLAFFFSPLFPIILAAALSIKLLFRQWHSSPSLSWRGELDPAAAIPCSSVAWRRQWRWVCLSLLFSPSPFQFFFSQHLFPIKSLFSRPRRPSSLSQYRDHRPRRCHPCVRLARRWRRLWVFPSFLFSPPPLRFFLTASFFQLNCYSVVCAGRPPSVSEGNEGPLPPSPARELRGEDDEVMVSLPLVSIPPHSKFLLTATFSNEITRQLAAPAVLPQSIKGSRARCCHTCPWTMPLQASNVSLSVLVILPLFPMFSHSSHFQLNCYSIQDSSPTLSQQGK